MNKTPVPTLFRVSWVQLGHSIVARMGTVRIEGHLPQKITLDPPYALHSTSVMQLLLIQLFHISQLSEKRGTVARLHHQIPLSL